MKNEEKKGLSLSARIMAGVLCGVLVLGVVAGALIAFL